MKLCISQATTMSTSFEGDLDAYARAGWEAVEVWLTKLEQFLQTRSIERTRFLFDERGLTPAAAATQGGLFARENPERDEHWNHFRRRLEQLGALGIPTLVIVPDFLGPVDESAIGSMSASLSRAVESAAEFGVTLALEFQKSAGLCASLDTAIALVEQVDSTHLGVCLDVFHYYTGPSKFEDLGYLNSCNLAWVQLSDLSGVPRELAGDSDRILPGDGDFQLGPILKQVLRLAGPQYLSLEVMNPNLWSIPADRVAAIGRQSMVRVVEGLAPAEPLATSAGGA
jgi:sugar phosphate isomerase/epimerase